MLVTDQIQAEQAWHCQLDNDIKNLTLRIEERDAECQRLRDTIEEYRVSNQELRDECDKHLIHIKDQEAEILRSHEECVR